MLIHLDGFLLRRACNEYLYKTDVRMTISFIDEKDDIYGGWSKPKILQRLLKVRSSKRFPMYRR